MNTEYDDIVKKLAVLSLTSKGEEEAASELIKQIEVTSSDIETEEMLIDLDEDIE